MMKIPFVSTKKFNLKGNPKINCVKYTWKMVEFEMIFQILKILSLDLTNCCQPLKNPIMNISGES